VRYISHELRTPLNTAFLGLKLLSSDLKASNDPKDMERYETLCDVNMSCTAAVDILNDLLCYEKLESGIMELRRENIVVDSFLNYCVTMFSAQARECGVTITMITNSDIEANRGDGNTLSTSLLPTDSIFADKFKMDQVIRNLMSNALKFTPRGGVVTVKATFVHDTESEAQDPPPPPPPSPWQDADTEGEGEGEGEEGLEMKHPGLPSRLSVSHFRRYTSVKTRVEGKLVIVVKDTGAGISRENQKRLFNEIVQFNPEKLQAGGGSGLGLWITQEILNLHDGSISVSSEGEGMGSSFTIELPMIRQPACLSSVPLAPPTTPSSSPSPASYESYGKSSNSELENFAVCDDIAGALSWSKRRICPPDTPLKDGPCPSYSTWRPPAREVLVVDDSRLNRKMLLKCLRADGHTCFEAEDGLEAIAMVKERIDHARGGHGRPFDAVLMDFIMPNMDGPTATQEIRALGYTAPIFGVTGNGE
jgi:signal transduction histidine kinase/CheY-like chemotaxis protein